MIIILCKSDEKNSSFSSWKNTIMQIGHTVGYIFIILISQHRYYVINLT